MSPKSCIVRVGITLFAVVAFCCCAFFVGIPSFMLASSALSVRRALDDARSVTVSEFIQYPDLSSRNLIDRELVLQSIIATPEQVSRFRAATGGFLEISSPLSHKRCYDAHHRVEITRTDGSTVRFDVCFECSNFRFGRQPIQTMPARWQPRLERFFTEFGMPPRSRQEYTKLTPGNA